MKNWRLPFSSAVLISAICLLAGCSKADTEAAIRKAIEDHLATRPGLSSSEILLELQKVDVTGDSAVADVVFRSRKDPNASMNFHYQLHNDGSGWKIPPTSMSGDSSPHSSTAAPSRAEPPLPEGHPKVN